MSEPDDTQRSSLIDELRLTLNQGSGKNRLVYSGIATGRHCRSFWPLIPGDTQYPARKVIVKMRSGEQVPPNGNKSHLEYIFPNFITMRFFEQPKVRLPSGRVKS